MRAQTLKALRRKSRQAPSALRAGSVVDSNL